MTHPVPVLVTLVAATCFAVAAERGKISGWPLVRIDVALLLSQIAIAVFNDYCDGELGSPTDGVKELPGLFGNATTILFFVGAMTAASIAVALTFGWLSAILVAGGSGAGLAYSARLKPTPLSWLPFAVAFPLLPIWECLVLHARVSQLWSLAAIGVPCAVAIHIADSIPDITQDREHGLHGLAVVLGESASIRLSQVLMLVAAVVSLAVSWQLRHPAFGFIAAGIGLLAAVGIGLEGGRTSGTRYVIAIGGLALGSAWIAGLTL